MNILIIEDEPAIADNLIHVLEMDGYQISWFRTAGEGLDYLKNNDPALLVLDVGLPDGNGFEPLSAIKGASEILQMPLPQEKVSHFANNIERESGRMQQLIEQLLELAKLEKMPQLEQVASVPVKSLFETVIQSSEAKLSLKQVNCTLDIPENLTVRGDSFLLQQALFNLMDNALDFVTEGGTIQARANKSEHQIRISIFNQGPHIPEYALARLTERFYSLSRGNGVKSTGLGLNFVEQVAKLHNGELIIANVTGGVCVELILGLVDQPTP